MNETKKGVKPKVQSKVKPKKTIGAFLKTSFKILCLTIILLGILGMGIGSFIISEIIKDAPELDVSKIYATESTIIYDKDGNIISEFGIQKREWVTVARGSQR